MSKGITYVDIYWRERIRMKLDEPLGLSIRFQYLSMPLSPEEQTAFFSTYGSELQGLVTLQHRKTEEHFERLEFLHWMSQPITSVRLSIEFNDRYRFEDLANVRVLAALTPIPPERNKGWYVGGEFKSKKSEHKGTKYTAASPRSFYSFSEDLEPTLSPVPSSLKIYSYDFSLMDCSFNETLQTTPNELNGRLLKLLVSPSAAKRIATAQFQINGYVMASWQKIEWTPTNKLSIAWPQSDPIALADWLVASNEDASHLLTKVTRKKVKAFAMT